MVRQQLLSDLKKVVRGLGFPTDDIVCYIPQNPAFGDYATNIALQLAKLKQGKGEQTSIEIANEILEKLKSLDFARDNLSEIKIAGGGFINFFIKPEVFREDLLNIKEGFGHSEIGKGKKVILEHTGVNPNKAMHIGHLRNALIGDSLARILKKTGYSVEVQNYIDDTGVQVADTYIGTKYLEFRTRGLEEHIEDYYWDLYAAVNKKYEDDPDFLAHRTEVLKEVENPDSETAKQVQQLAIEITKTIQAKLAEFNIFHDLYVRESDILKFGFWQSAFEILKKTPGFEYEEQGKNKGTWLVRFGDGGDDEHSADKIFLRSDGTTTYTAKDFAYNLWKFGLLGKDFKYKPWVSKPDGSQIYITATDGQKMDQFDKGDLVDTVIDERQAYLQQVIIEIFKRLGYQKQADGFRHISYGVVTLSAKTAQALGVMLQEQRKSYAMAGRKGIGVKIADLQNLLTIRISEERKDKKQKSGGLAKAGIANNAIKYFMLKYNSATEVVFDFDQALSIYGATGPYLQYTHARASNILEKTDVVQNSGKMEYLPNSEELILIKKLLEWPNILYEARNNLEPSGVATFAFEFAQSFNSFYEKSRVLNAETEASKSFRINLVTKFRLVFKDVLDALGIEAPERM
ncbi:arginine--tRNA ligase [Candidatus Daviesbacteria bacterium]|nr:arginine--tRNA ligase [Candidatus Daviesbacteria bacterium]